MLSACCKDKVDALLNLSMGKGCSLAKFVADEGFDVIHGGDIIYIDEDTSHFGIAVLFFDVADMIGFDEMCKNFIISIHTSLYVPLSYDIIKTTIGAELLLQL